MELIHDDFLLQSDLAGRLYHDHAKHWPLIDYHSHLPPDIIAANQNFANITRIWLAGDHYKWRAQRTLGIEERYITGNAPDRDKFRKWAEAVPYTLRNPLYHWTHMELKNPFGITELLSPDNADHIYDQTEQQLQTPQFTPQGLLEHFRVEMVGTTDDPADSLEHHRAIGESKLATKVLPSFRPDKAFQLSGGDVYRDYIQRLSQAAAMEIKDINDLFSALRQRMEYFHSLGCRISDHGLARAPYREADGAGLDTARLDKVFRQVLAGDDTQAAAYEEGFTFHILTGLCRMYHALGWVQQFHLGPLRNNNTRKLQMLGPDTGYDSIGDFRQGESLSVLLNHLEKDDQLAKTILYNVNPADNAVFAAMTGNFQGEGVKGKIQFGSAWWFMDQLDGMTDQLNTLSNIGLLSCFVGMLTDSRSFLSYPRHEYFRRLLCNMLAEDVRKGYLPPDEGWIGKIVADVCYHNAKNYFQL